MLKNFTRFFFYATLFAVFGVIYPPRVGAQTGPIFVQPTAFYRFEISANDGGYLLTHVFNEGAANGHPFVPFNNPTFDGLGIYRPPDGYTADPSTGLVRLYRWRVVQNGWRVYYYYSTTYSEHGSDYFYEGVAGWVFPQGTVATINPAFVEPLPVYPLSIWYSTDLGFWYGFSIFPDTNAEQPPFRSGKAGYYLQGTVASLPQTCIDPQFNPQPPVGCAYAKLFNPPPPPPPPPPPSSCDATLAMRRSCARLGGFWDDESCSCQYY
jgi:hypothetical protein